uniref:Si:ch211-151h10.2 n=1 Tax=Astyanax mexicanus TaxID=7994 RepID=A0A3B1JJB0_ASTMX
RLNWTHWSSWLQGLGPAAVLWLVVQEESPLYSSLSLLQAGGRLLQAVLIWTILALCTYLICFLEQDAGHLVSVLSSVLDGFVVSVLQEPVSGESSLPQIRCLLTRLEALHKGSLSEGQSLQIKEEEEEVSQEDSSLRDRVKHIHTYLQDVGALRCLLQVQDEYGGCLAEVQQGLQEHWELLEDLHTRVTLQPDQHQNPEDPNTVLSDTESLYTQLGLFRRTVNECQTHLNSCTHLLQGLESRQKVLAETVGLTLDSTWIKDFVQSNSQQVQENFLSLEQQTLTFVTHLRGLRAPGDSGGCDLEPVQTTPSSPLSSVPVYTAVLSTDSTDPHLDPDLDTKPPPRPSSKLSAMSCLCGV